MIASLIIVLSACVAIVLICYYNDKRSYDREQRIEPAPARPSGTVRVKLKYKGHSKPIPEE